MLTPTMSKQLLQLLSVTRLWKGTENTVFRPIDLRSDAVPCLDDGTISEYFSACTLETLFVGNASSIDNHGDRRNKLLHPDALGDCCP